MGNKVEEIKLNLEMFWDLLLNYFYETEEMLETGKTLDKDRDLTEAEIIRIEGINSVIKTLLIEFDIHFNDTVPVHDWVEKQILRPYKNNP